MDVNKIQSVYGAQNVSKVSKVGNAGEVNGITAPKGKDKADLTSSAVDFRTALNALKEVDDVREDLVNDIKEKMNSGTYDMDIDALIDKMISRM